jgi:hypothetical protein
MVDTSKKAEAGNTAVPSGDSAPHDRVAMLSLNKDGSVDQHNPELIGDKDFALRATKEQFKEQAVSAVDDAARSDGAIGGPITGDEVTQDPAIEKLQSAHDKAAESAEKRATSVVDALHPDKK